MLRDIYPLILDHGPREAPVFSALLNELRVIRGFIPIIEGDLGRNSCVTAFCSDSSTHGYALHETPCQVSEMLDVTVWRERWRFVIDHPALTRRVDGGLQGHLADVPDMALRFEAWFEKEMRDLDCLLPEPEPPPRCPADVRTPLRVRQEVAGLVPQLPPDWVRPERWRRVVAGAWRRPEAIHHKEARAALLGFRRAAQQPRNFGLSLLSLGDNLGEILAFDRGHARDHELLALVRRGAGIQIATGIAWRRRYVETERNPSDADSRLADAGLLLPGQTVLGPGSGRHRRTLLAAAVGPHWRPLAPRPAAPVLKATPRASNLCPWDAVRPADGAVLDGPPATFPRQRESAVPRASAPGRGRRPANSIQAPRLRVRPGGRPRDAQLPAARATRAAARRPPGRAPLPRGKIFLEVFAGCGWLTAAFCERGLRSGLPIELRSGRHFDLLDPRVFEEICRWIRAGRVWMLQLGTPCTRWSVARTSSGSSTSATDRLGLLCARRSAALIRLCHAHHVYWTLENPASPKLLQWRPLRTQIERQRAVSVTLHMCAYGAAWLKPTTVVGTLPGFTNLGRCCPGGLRHVIFQGIVTFVENGKKETAGGLS